MRGLIIFYRAFHTLDKSPEIRDKVSRVAIRKKMKKTILRIELVTIERTQ